MFRRNKAPQVCIDDTNFIFATNFRGDPARDRFGDNRRKATIYIPDPEQAKDPETFEPEYYTPIFLAYRDLHGTPLKYLPQVYLVCGDAEPLLLTEENVGKTIDEDIRVKNVNVVLNLKEKKNKPGEFTLYINKMYVEQDLDDDPYAARYRKAAKPQPQDDDLSDDPF